MMLPKRTLMVALLLVLAAGTFALGPGRSGPDGNGFVHQLEAAASQEEMDADAMMENAMSAAPASIAESATIMSYEMDADGKFVVLREGSNGWYCQPDNTETPGNDPWCFDQAWMDWVYAFANGDEPKVTTPGITYMLQGGSDASNTDPLATEPAEGEDWVTTPPHVMLLLPGDLEQTGFSTDRESGGPYIMWSGTPYAHVMVPIADAEGGM